MYVVNVLGVGRKINGHFAVCF